VQARAGQRWDCYGMNNDTRDKTQGRAMTWHDMAWTGCGILKPGRTLDGWTQQASLGEQPSKRAIGLTRYSGRVAERETKERETERESDCVDSLIIHLCLAGERKDQLDPRNKNQKEIKKRLYRRQHDEMATNVAFPFRMRSTKGAAPCRRKAGQGMDGAGKREVNNRAR
jgi:hypothetical protein